MEDFRSETRILVKKLLAICPHCKKQIYGNDINLANIDKTKIKSWPLPYVYCHSHENWPMHALTMYLDSTLTVRAREVSDYITIQK
ncbi:MAG: hypothetical protein ACFFBP_02725 [Promethearchaeota archaeon]